MQVSIEVVAGLVGLVVLPFSFALMLKQDKIHHLRELMRLRMTEGGKIRVTLEEQLAIEQIIKAPVSQMGAADYLKVNAEFKLRGQDLVAVARTNDYRTN